jgi:glucose/sorbosone dehydrogenase
VFKSAMRKVLLTIGLALALTAPAAAQGTPPIGDGSGGVQYTQIGSFDTPVHAARAPGRRNRDLLFVVEKEGRVMVVRSGTTLPTPFLDITDRVRSEGEEGLLSIAFHPNYLRNRAFYVYFTNSSGDNQVVEFRRRRSSRVRAKLASVRTVIVIPHPDDATNHNGGQIAFGPDRLLYIAPGDGATTPEAAQDLSNLRGKVLRIRPLRRKRHRHRKGGRRSAAPPYFNPRGNPFVGRPGLDEIYAVGLRNPFRFSFDSLTGALSIADVGGGSREEVDFRRRGKARGVNFGWPRFEGNLLLNSSVSAPGAVGPIHDYGHSSPCNAIIGGFVVRDARLTHQYGRYLYTDNCHGDLRTLIPSQGGASDDQAVGGGLPTVDSPSSFGEGAGNRLYLISLAGPLYRLDPAP